MTIQDIRTLLDAELLLGEDMLGQEAENAICSDLMSDVLAYSHGHSVLITGLCNPQVIRTAEMMDIFCIVFVRGKRPDEAMLALARQKDIAIMTTGRKMFTCCGILFREGLSGGGEDE